jgi:hypothetical protein
VPGGNVAVKIHVRAPQWAKVDHLVVYSNSAIVAQQTIPAAQGTDYATTIALQLPKDAWIVAEVTGTGNMFPVLTPTEFPPLDATVIIKALSIGLDLSALPLTSKLRPSRVHTSTPYAITNPIWIDVDGGGFTAPKPPLPPRPAGGAPPDIRAQFDALPEVSP